MLDGKWRFAFTAAESHEQECFTLFMTTSAILSYYLKFIQFYFCCAICGNQSTTFKSFYKMSPLPFLLFKLISCVFL
ncbi:hypothetical protein WN943_026001 [Citrus x changshan-huyou]